MENKNDLRVIFCNESTSDSILADIFTFGILTALLFINYNWLGDSVLILSLILFCFFTKLLAHSSKRLKRMTPEEALKYLQANYKKKERSENGSE